MTQPTQSLMHRVQSSLGRSLLGQREARQWVPFPASALSANDWPCQDNSENRQMVVSQVCCSPIVIPYTISHMGTASLHKPARPGATFESLHAGLARQHAVRVLPAELLAKVCLCFQSPFPSCLPYLLVLALDFLLAETISLLPVSTTALLGPNQDSGQSRSSSYIQNLAAGHPQTNQETKNKGWA